MSNTIITAWEVVKYGPVQKEYPTAYICNHIARVEKKAFNKCYLGLKFYKEILNDLEDISDIMSYSANTTYNEGDKVSYEGVPFISINSSHSFHPEDEGYWEVLPKFKSDKFNELWDEYMKYWLSFEILYNSIRYATYQAGSKGLVTQFSENTGIQTVKRDEFNAYKKELKHDADDQLDLMFEYLVEMRLEEDLDFGIKQVNEACGKSICKPPSKSRRRRFFFKK